MNSEELTSKYYELASKIGELTVEISELKKALPNGKALTPKQIVEATTELLEKLGVITDDNDSHEGIDEILKTDIKPYYHQSDVISYDDDSIKISGTSFIDNATITDREN